MDWVMFRFTVAVPCQKHAKSCAYGITAPFFREILVKWQGFSYWEIVKFCLRP